MQRKPILARLVWLAAAPVLLPVVKAGAVSATAYTYQRLSPPASANTSSVFPNSVNASGLVGGMYSPPGSGAFHACVWVPDSHGQYAAGAPLPELDGSIESRIYGINSVGVVVGECESIDSQSTVHTHATIWIPSPAAPAYTPVNFEQQSGISAQNTVVSAVSQSGANTLIAGAVDQSPFAADSQGDLAPLSVPSSAVVPFATPSAINSHGDVGGTAAIGRALLWPHALAPNGTSPLDITPGGADGSADLNAINEAGLAVGYYQVDSQHNYHAYRLDPNQHSVITSQDDLGVPAGAVQSEALGINNTGKIVGYSDAGAFVWAAPAAGQPASAGTMTNLNSVTAEIPTGETLETAHAVNDTGLIVGYSHPQSSAYVGWVLTPGTGSTGGGTPAAPTALAGVGLSDHQVVLTFQDNSTNETGFQIQRSTVKTFSPSTRVTVLGNLPSHDGSGATLLWIDNSGLSAHKKYYYRVVATGDAGNATSAVATVTSGSAPLALSVSLKGKVGQTASGHLAFPNPLPVAIPINVPGPSSTAPFTITPNGAVTAQPGSVTAFSVAFVPTTKKKVTVHTNLTLNTSAQPDPQLTKLFPIPVTLTGQGK